MNRVAKKQCLERGEWYVARIDDLLRYIQDKPRLDSDEVQLCQAMLREILARFRADLRPPVDGKAASMEEATFHWSISEAGERLRVTPMTRPNRRWLDDLATCRRCVREYLDQLAVV